MKNKQLKRFHRYLRRKKTDKVFYIDNVSYSIPEDDIVQMSFTCAGIEWLTKMKKDRYGIYGAIGDTIVIVNN